MEHKAELANCDDILSSVRKISVLAGVLETKAVELVVQILQAADKGEPHPEPMCAELFRILAESAEMSHQPPVGNAWQNYLLEAILNDDNVYARKAEMVDFSEIGPALVSQMRFELGTLRMLYNIPLDLFMDSFPSIDNFMPIQSGEVDSPRLQIKHMMHSSSNWPDMARKLANFYVTSGAGEFGQFRAFRWASYGGDGWLQGVASPDTIRLQDLVEYEWQREAVRRNTQKLLKGLPANNMLLYGDRGTGKSSTVKAMLNEFGNKRLRLVEVSKDNLIDLPDILSILRKRPEKFILFIDDLSFEENETQYKALKAVLEGGLEARPINVALYATSNRRNLIREHFSDRVVEDDEVHPGDTMQEKLSLSDRFGLKLPFLAPDQDEYLRIVTALMDRAGIEMTEALRKQSLAWQHARSGRSARQFVDYIIGEKALES